MKASIPLLLMLALSATASAWGEEPPVPEAAPLPPTRAPASPTGEELPYGAGYEARQLQAAERERSQKAPDVQRPEAPAREVPARTQGARPERPVSRAPERPSDARPVRPERRR